jgi:uncharacterized protein (DUF2252 family)
MATRTRVPHPSVEERRAKGKEAAGRTPPSSHVGWAPATDRPDPVALLQEQDATREPDLVPVRHGRMLVSPFSFYRGTAKIMAADLNGTPTAGLDVQLCGDAHLSNFGAFASPERRLLFDLNDFDETLPGPFEYDVKRMAASFTIAGRNNGFAKADTKAATRASVAAYREAMASFAAIGTLDIWYAHLDEDELLKGIRGAAAEASKAKKGKKATKETKVATRAKRMAEKTVAKAHTRDSLQALSKLGELVDGRYRIVSQPPIVVPMRDLEGAYGIPREEMERLLREQFRAYRATLRDDQRQLLERFQLVDMARKVVGVGSVGTRAFIALLQGRDQQDPLFLQVKEATASVLEDHRPAGGPGPADDAGRQRHLPWLDQGRRHQPPLLLAAATGHERLGRGRGDGAGRPQLLCRHLRLDTGPGPCPLGRPGRDRRLPGRRRPVRPVDHRLLHALRRPERARLPGVCEGDPLRPAASPGRHLTSAATPAPRHPLLPGWRQRLHRARSPGSGSTSAPTATNLVSHTPMPIVLARRPVVGC